MIWELRVTGVEEPEAAALADGDDLEEAAAISGGTLHDVANVFLLA